MTAKFPMLQTLLLLLLINVLEGGVGGGGQGEEWQAPTVLVALFVRNKGHLLRDTLELLEKQDYPKARIALYVRSDHNEDDTLDILTLRNGFSKI